MSLKSDQVQENAKRFSLSLLIALAVFASLLFVFWLITDEVVFEKENDVDYAIHKWLSTYRSSALTKIMVFFTFFGSRGFLLPAYILIVCYYFFHKKRSLNSLAIAAVALSGAAILSVLKNTFKRARPLEPLIEHTKSFSYPSGHSFSAFTFSGIIIYLVWQSNLERIWKWTFTVLLFLFAGIICISRVYLHVHYASDVIAGFCLSFLWLLTCYFILNKFNLLKDFSRRF